MCCEGKEYERAWGGGGHGGARIYYFELNRVGLRGLEILGNLE